MQRIIRAFITWLILLSCILGGNNFAYSQTNNNLLSDENLVLVEVKIDRLFTSETIEVYQHQGGYLLPLGALSYILDFAIETDIDNKEARGFFVKESQTFYLNINNNEVVINGKRQDIGGRNIAVNNYDIYVDASLFSQWFDIDTDLKFSDLMLVLNPKGKLPVIERLERAQLRAKLNRLYTKSKVFPITQEPYKIYDTPFIDADIGYDFGDGDNTLNRVSYSLLSQGDLGYLTTKLSVSGEQQSDNEEDSLRGLRFSAGREDKDGNLLGKLNATSFSIGDISAVSTTLVSSQSRGRGFTASNEAVGRPDQFDSTQFIGDSQPGWEVEIYRNGVLQDFQLVGNDGRYEFEDVPIFIGNNIFKIVEYGPQGQIRENIYNQNINSAMLQKGEFSYRVSADEKSRTIFGVDEGNVPISHKQGMRYVGNVEYGITGRTTAGLGLVRTPLRDFKFHEYQTFNLKNSFSNLYTDANFAYDSTDGGWATKLAVQTAIKEVRVKAEYSRFDNFVSEVERPNNRKRKSIAGLDLDGRYAGVFSSGISYRFNSKLEEFEGNSNILTLGNRLSSSIYGIGFSNNIDYRNTKNGTIDTSNTNGSFSIRGRYKEVSLRFTANYQVQPESHLNSLNFVTQKRLDHDMSLRLGVRKDLTGDNRTVFDSSINKIFKYCTWSIIGQADDDNNYSIGTKLSFSIGREPRNNDWILSGRGMASQGAVSAMAFLDQNYNEVYDEGDEIIPDVEFITTGHILQSGGDKPTVITKSSSPEPSNIEVDYTSVENPFWLPVNKGFGVISRAGVVTPVNFAFQIATEIDGTVYLKNSPNARPISRVKVNLLNEEGDIAAQVTSEFDGFYLFEGVLPGKYTVEIDPESLKRFKAINSTSKELTITKDSDIISNIDLTITTQEGYDGFIPATPPQDIEDKDIQMREYSKQAPLKDRPDNQEYDLSVIEKNIKPLVILEKMSVDINCKQDNCDHHPLIPAFIRTLLNNLSK